MHRAWWTPVRIIRTGVVALSVLVGLPASLAEFLPRISFDVSEPFDADPLSSNAEIHNIGLITLQDVQPKVGVCAILGSNYSGPLPASTLCSGPMRGWLVSPKFKRKSLRMDESFTFQLGQDVFAPAAKYAEISVVIEYRLVFWPIKRDFEFKLVTKQRPDGKLEWLHEPLE